MQAPNSLKRISFSKRFTVIDNNILFAISHMMGARAFEVHVATYWPEWGVRLIDNLEAGRYPEVQRSIVEERCPSTSCEPRSRRPTRRATAISTSSAWSSSD